MRSTLAQRIAVGDIDPLSKAAMIDLVPNTKVHLVSCHSEACTNFPTQKLIEAKQAASQSQSRYSNKPSNKFAIPERGCADLRNYFGAKPASSQSSKKKRKALRDVEINSPPRKKARPDEPMPSMVSKFFGGAAIDIEVRSAAATTVIEDDEDEDIVEMDTSTESITMPAADDGMEEDFDALLAQEAAVMYDVDEAEDADAEEAWQAAHEEQQASALNAEPEDDSFGLTLPDDIDMSLMTEDPRPMTTADAQAAPQQHVRSASLEPPPVLSGSKAAQPAPIGRDLPNEEAVAAQDGKSSTHSDVISSPADSRTGPKHAIMIFSSPQNIESPVSLKSPQMSPIGKAAKRETPRNSATSEISDFSEQQSPELDTKVDERGDDSGVGGLETPSAKPASKPSKRTVKQEHLAQSTETSASSEKSADEAVAASWRSRFLLKPKDGSSVGHASVRLVLS